MSSANARLAAIGSSPLGAPSGVALGEALAMEGLQRCGLDRLLALKDGFYAFESALHVFPSTPGAGEVGLEEWNSRPGWRAEYQSLAEGCFFFAEDVFGGQFCLYDGVVMSFDPETGDKSFLARDVEGWAARVLTDYEMLTGYPLAHEWQSQYGPIPRGQRLMPRMPFVTGGSFAIDNLALIDAAQGMRSRANLAVQIKDLPDGTKIQFEVVDPRK